MHYGNRLSTYSFVRTLSAHTKTWSTTVVASGAAAAACHVALAPVVALNHVTVTTGALGGSNCHPEL
jgi:hypothetical protein